MSPIVPDDDTTPEGDDFVAAEYVLGVLPEQERREVARRIETDKPFAQLVARWQKQFDPLNSEFEDAAAPHHVKNRIDQRLFAIEVAATASFWNNLTFWRGLAFAALAFAVIGIGSDLSKRSGKPDAQLVASMEVEGSPVHTLAIFDERTRKLKVTVVTGDMPKDRSVELWLIAGSEPPISLGLMVSPEVTEFNLSPPLLEKLREGTTLALTVEPVGGAPKGIPTGPIVAAGAVRRI
jgi:anti-sigma-K factor RskA